MRELEFVTIKKLQMIIDAENIDINIDVHWGNSSLVPWMIDFNLKEMQYNHVDYQGWLDV